MENFDIESIISIKQMPQIFYTLEEVGKKLDKELKEIDKMPCNEDTKVQIKKVRSNINKTLEDFETKRIQIKKKILEPYDIFEEKYQEEIKEKLQNAEKQLKDKIYDIEQEQIWNKTTELINYIDENLESLHLVTFIKAYQVIELAPLKINLSTSLKSLKDQALKFINKVANEIELIKLEEKYSEEILWDYIKNDFDYANSKLYVLNKHKEIDEIKKENEKIDELTKKEEEVIERVDEITTPVEVIEDDELLQCTFTIKTTKEKILLLKEFMKENGILTI